MADIIHEVALPASVASVAAVKNPMGLASKLPHALLSKFMLGLRFGSGLVVFGLGALIIIGIIMYFLNKAHVNVGNIVQNDKTALGL